MSEPKRMSTGARIRKGNDRIMKLHLRLMQQYSYVPNLIVFPALGWGNGIDILVTDSTNKIFELREVTNFGRFAQNGNLICINPGKWETDLIKSLKRNVYWKYWGDSRKRFYPTINTKRFLDISYETNLRPSSWKNFLNNGITPIIWYRTEYPKGYTVEDGNGNKTYFLDNEQQVQSIAQIV